MRVKTPSKLLEVLADKDKVSDMLSAVADFVEKAHNFDSHLPEDVVEFLQREDAKVQLILRVIAVGKVQRALELDDELRTLQALFKEKIQDVDWKARIGPGGAIALMQAVTNIQHQEMAFLKELAELGEINLKDVIDKLVLAFGSAKLGTGKSGRIRKLEMTDITLPDDPAERESMRRILTGIMEGEAEEDDDEPSGRTHEVEAEDKKVAGENPGVNPPDRGHEHPPSPPGG